ncbi:MAG: hypothetical protein HY904_07885 [Deltaproteobacteria bacterium]|nr:hypothetical protein [Deltaproteobacteria bacterium]
MTNPTFGGGPRDDDERAAMSNHESDELRARHPVIWWVIGILVSGFYLVVFFSAVLLVAWGAGLAERHLGLPAIHCLVAFGIMSVLLVGARLKRQLAQTAGSGRTLEAVLSDVAELMAETPDHDGEPEFAAPRRGRTRYRRRTPASGLTD